MEAYLNSINNRKSQFNETKKLTQLSIDHRYPVQEFKIVKTKYGTSKIVTLFDDLAISDGINRSFAPETESRSIDVLLYQLT